MSGRLLAIAAALAVLSAAIGATAAYLLRDSEPAPPPAAVVVAATPAPSQEPESQPAAVETSPQPEPEEPPAVRQAQAQESQPEPEPEPQPAPQQAVQDVQQPEPQQQAIVSAAPLLTLTPTILTQGEAVSVLVEASDQGVTAAAATVNGRSWSLSETSDGLWWGIVAIPRDAASGVRELVVDLYGAGGWLSAASATLTVLESGAPLEDIVLGGDGTGEPLDPAEVQRDHDVRFVDHVEVTGPPLWDGPWILPVEGEVTGVFGAPRSYDGVRSEQWHHGHDIAAQHGDPLVAPAHGVVVWTGEIVLHGIGVIINHGAGVYSGYWHMSLVVVEPGTEVAPGDWLGNIGTTGLSTGPHLHWEVIIQGIDVDPIQWTTQAQPPLPHTLSPS